MYFWLCKMRKTQILSGVFMVPEVGLCASRAVGLRSAQRLCRSGAPRPLQKPHRGFCDTGLRVPDRKTKTAPWGRFFVLAKHANCNTTAPHLVSRGAFWYRVGCILAQVGCIFRGRGASQNYLDYSAIWSDYYSKIRAWRFYG